MRVHALTAVVGFDAQLSVRGERGELAGTWKAFRSVKIGEVFHVEVTVMDPPHQWVEIHREAGSARTRVLESGQMEVRGQAVGLDEQGVLTLSVSGGLVDVETDGPAPVAVLGHTFRLVIDRLDIYPVDL